MNSDSTDLEIHAGLVHAFSDWSETGAATGLKFLTDGTVQAAAEPIRRGGGDAGVVTLTP